MKRAAAASLLVVAAIAWFAANGPAATAQTAQAQTQAELCTPGTTGSAPAGGVSAPAEGTRFAAPTVDVNGEFHYERDVIGRPDGNTVVKIVLVACGKNQVLPEGSEWTKTDPGSSIPFAWTTPALPWNGRYAARVQVQSPAGEKVETRTFGIVVPPAVPTDVRAAQASDGISVSWAKNPEPDIIGYVIHRLRPSGAPDMEFGIPAPRGVARPSIVDHPPVGEWHYNVVALRQGADDGQGLASDPSPPVGASYAPPPPPTTDGGDGGVTNAPPPSQQGSTNPAISKAGKVDLSNFSALLDQRAKAAARAQEEAADTGFQDTLPFQPGDEPALADGDQEAGAGETQGEGQRIVSDDSDRRRAIGSLAAALLLFVMFQQVRWVRNELDEADLEATTPGDEIDAEPEAAAPDGEAAEPEDKAAPDVTAAVPTDANAPDAADADAASSDAPHLDVPVAPVRTRRRRELGQGAAETESAPRSANAGRATRRLPPRPADDRGQGPAPVRPRGRGAGGGDGRVPVG